jgi:hypothetical protein
VKNISVSVPRVRKVNRSVLLEGSSMRRIVPDTQAALRGMMNSNPSPDTSVTYSEGVDDEDAILEYESGCCL